MSMTTCPLCLRYLFKKAMVHLWGGDWICNEQNAPQCKEIENAIYLYKFDNLQPNSKGVTDCDRL